MIILPASHRPLTVSQRGRKCYAFEWIGQPFSSCDNCGHPYWKHSHYATIHANPKGGIGKKFHAIITVEEAIGCYYKWGS